MTKASTPIIQQTPPSQTGAPNVEFRRSDFEQAIWDKGYRVVHEKALKCPCKSKNGNQQSSCKNCGGSGWIFINPVETRMILHSMNRDTQFKEWSEETMGKVNISSMSKDEISYMDRITLLDGKGSFSQALHFKEKDGILFAFTAYLIKEVEYLGLFIDTDSKLMKLEKDVDFTFDRNILYLDSKYTSTFTAAGNDLSVSIRYTHSPQFYILDLMREVMTTKVKDKGKDSYIHMPISAVARRGHYILDGENLSETRLVDNSYDTTCK